jgi:hypothetical protein
MPGAGCCGRTVGVLAPLRARPAESGLLSLRTRPDQLACASIMAGWRWGRVNLCFTLFLSGIVWFVSSRQSDPSRRQCIKWNLGSSGMENDQLANHEPASTAGRKSGSCLRNRNRPQCCCLFVHQSMSHSAFCVLILGIGASV